LVLKGIQIDGDPVAGGGFGDVYKARYQRQEIALKVLKVYQKSDMDKLLKVIGELLFYLDTTKSYGQDFACEAVTWRQLHHPNVLPFYGVFHLDKTPPRVCLACPWLENGNVVQYLANKAPDANCVCLVSSIICLERPTP
jgi:serine/threonine protein kinase